MVAPHEEKSWSSSGEHLNCLQFGDCYQAAPERNVKEEGDTFLTEQSLDLQRQEEGCKVAAVTPLCSSS